MKNRYRTLSLTIGLVELSFINGEILLDVRIKEKFEEAPLFDNVTHLDFF